jgi:predicted permease
MTVNGESHEILGIMPVGFAHRGADLFLPVQMALDPEDRGSHFLATYARLKSDVSPEQARQEMHALGERLQEEFGHNHGIDVQSYAQLVTGDAVTPLRLLMGAVSLVLLIACANVANLLLASGLARRRELAVRTALGATGWDLVRQLTIESVVLALAGGALGLVLAITAMSTFVALAEGALPRMSAVGFDGIVLAFAATLSLVTGLLCGLWPVVRLRRRSVSGDMREGDLRSGSGAGGRRFGSGLVVAEVALAFCLLVAAGLLIRNLVSLEARPTGFETERRVAFDIAPTGSRYEAPAQRLALYRELQARLVAAPGVERVGSTSHLPMYEFGWNGEVTLVGGNPWPDDEAPLINWRWVGGDYLDTMGIPLIAGRWFNETDREGAPRAAILSEMTAEKFWPGEDPIGRRLSQGGPSNPQFEVVGIVAGVRARSLLRGSEYEMYIPIGQDPFLWQTFVLRTASPDPTSVMPQVRRIVKALDPMLPVSEVQTLAAVVRESVDQPRLISSLAALFGTLAALLAAVGVYGVMAHHVRRERREYGIRLALGADPGRVQRFVARRGLVLGGLGIVLGAAAALLLTPYVGLLLNDVQPTDPVVYAACAGGLLGISLLAGYLPARTASRTDPIVVLRAD